MKPWEETWRVRKVMDPVEGFETEAIVNEAGEVLFRSETTITRDELAAQAPAMARLLLTLRGAESECPGCSWHRMVDDGDEHTDDCSIVAVLKAAGVLT